MPDSTTKQGIIMKRFFITSLVITATALFGCSSLNNSFNSYAVFPAAASEYSAPVITPSTPELPKQPSAVTEESEKEFKCPPFRYELSGSGPSLPEDKILAAGNDIHKIEQIERQHIKDLRAHMTKMQSRLKYAILKHEMDCRMANSQ